LLLLQDSSFGRKHIHYHLHFQSELKHVTAVVAKRKLTHAVGKGLERVHDFGCGLELLPKRFHIVCLEMERPVNIALSKGMGALGAEIINSTSSLPNVAAIGLVEQLELECLGKTRLRRQCR
jgi:hypothetical protein